MADTHTAATDHCQNCGAPLYGEHCHVCGQPRRGLLRHLGSLVGDVVEALFNLDGRVVRTLPPLLLRPGFLPLEYFAGHRVRYVSPVRLFMFLCIATFIVARWASPSLTASVQDDDLQIGFGVQGGFADADTVAAVEAERARLLADLDRSWRASPLPGLRPALDEARQAVDAAADKRLAELNGTAEIEKDVLRFNGEPWDRETNPVSVPFAPAAVDDWVNEQISHIPDNLQRIRDDPDLMRNAFYSALPTALFVLVPLFAALLKLLYIYQRRLYMEHLIVALHGHAFLCLVALLHIGLFAFDSAQPWLSPWPLQAALWLWVPVYLWRQLRRVYGQNRWLTTLNFAILALLEVLLLSFTAAVAALVALVWL
jgi:hypothetical protein